MSDLNSIRKNYEIYEDAKIKQIAQHESRGLREDVLPILFEEIEKRKLDLNLIKWVYAERRQLSVSELEKLKSRIKNTTCSLCKRNRNLRGYKFETKTGLILKSYTVKYKLILCRECGNHKRKISTLQSLSLGWISPISIIAYPLLVLNKINIYLKEDELSERIIEQLIKGNIGIITINNDSDEISKKLVLENNKTQSNIITQ